MPTNRKSYDEVITGGMLRYFVTPGGSRPSVAPKYAGQDSVYMTIEGADAPATGGFDTINVHEPTAVGKFRRVGRSRQPSDLPTATVKYMQKRDTLPAHLTEAYKCASTFHMPVGSCRDLSNLSQGWSAYVRIFSNGEAGSVSLGGSQFDSDEAVMDEVEYTFDDIYDVGKVFFNEKASTEVTGEVKGIVYGSREQCADCGVSDDGTKWIYAVVESVGGSAASVPFLVYSTDGGLTWTELAITSIIYSDTVTGLAIANNRLIVVFSDATTGGVYTTKIDQKTGVPNSSWTKTTTGFVSGKQPNDIWVSNAREIWFAGNGGYIYKSTYILNGVEVVDAGDATTENLNRVTGLDDLIVLVGETDTIVYSEDRGGTFATATATGGGAGLDAVAVVDKNIWWVGDDAGSLYSTENGGTTWVDRSPIASITGVQDIVFITDEVGWAVAQATALAGLFSTIDGGRQWQTTDPRINNFPVFNKANRIAYPMVSNTRTAVNHIAMGGVATGLTDGIILVGSAAQF